MRHALTAAVLMSWLIVTPATSAGTVTIQDGTFNSSNETLMTTGTDATHTIDTFAGGEIGERHERFSSSSASAMICSNSSWLPFQPSIPYVRSAPLVSLRRSPGLVPAR